MEENSFLQELSALRARLLLIWDEIGFTESEKDEKTVSVKKALMREMRQIQDRELKVKNNLIKTIDEYGVKLHHLTTELKVPSIKEPDMNLTLMQLEKFLQKKLVYYQSEADRRVQELESLRSQEKSLCKKLLEDIARIPPDRIPSDETLEYLQKVIKSLEVELGHRERAFRSLRASIITHMEELNCKPITSLERDLLSNVEDIVALSQDNIHKMKTLSADLQLKVEKQKEKETKLREDIFVLWDRLSTDTERRDFFFSHLTESAADNIPKLEEKLKTLKELRHQNLGCFINRLKRELEEWWDKCYISEDEKENFVPYFSEEYTEEVLAEHEKEVQKYKDFYSHNEVIFQKIKKWQMLWTKVTELDEKANDKGRLFGNRGCALLQEEKERKKVNNELPRVEKDIEAKLKQWERENGRPFLVCGQTLTNFIKSQWQEYNDKKNREKQIRQSERNKQLHVDARLGTAKSTPGRKRNLPRTETMRNSKYLRTNENERTPSSSTTYVSTTLSRCSSRNNLGPSPNRVNYGPSPKHNRKRPLRKATSLRDQTNHQNTFNSSQVSCYDRFAEGIHRKSERENIRSSVVPSKSYYNSPRNATARGPLSLPKTPLSSSRATKFTPPFSASRRQPLTPSNSRLNTNYGSHIRSSTPKAPCTLPRRRSARLNASRGCFTASKKVASPCIRSQKGCVGASRLTTPIRNKLNFLM